MIILDYNKKNHKQIIHACVEALRKGKVVAYPTDTCYGLAVDVSNISAIKKLYKIKGRSFKKPISIIPPSISEVKKIVIWNPVASRLAKKFFPGPLTLVLGLRAKGQELRMLSAGTREIGIRQPKNQIALDLAKYLKKPITTTSANLAGLPECYSVSDLHKQFSKAKFKPDIIISAGKLDRRKPSTIVKVTSSLVFFSNKGGKGGVKILRQGPISDKQIIIALRAKR